MAKREFPRTKRRLNCALQVEGENHFGVARDLSPKGFFVQTSARIGPGTDVTVQVRPPSGGPIDLRATVLNRLDTPRRLATVVRGGIGCRLAAPPPEAYYRFLAATYEPGGGSGGGGSGAP